jgi:hypothetical protein
VKPKRHGILALAPEHSELATYYPLSSYDSLTEPDQVFIMFINFTILAKETRVKLLQFTCLENLDTYLKLSQINVVESGILLPV